MTNGRAKGANFEREISRMVIDHLGFDDVINYKTTTDMTAIYKYDRQPIRCVVYLSSINSDYLEKDYTATISFDAWCMLVRESL